MGEQGDRGQRLSGRIRDTGRVALRQLTLPDLHAILRSGALPSRVTVHPGALPPRFVVDRAVARIAAGEPALWWVPFLVLEEQGEDGSVVGGCAFKGPPRNGRVELLYGIAKSCRGRGIASAAVAQLAETAFARGAGEVLSEIEPRNAASIRVVQRCGFERLSERTADDGVRVEQWLLLRK